MITREILIEGGKLLKPHGFKGEINAAIDYILEPEDLRTLTFVMDVDGIFVPFFCGSARKISELKYILKFDDLNSDIDVKPYVNETLYFLKSQIAEHLGVSEDELETDSDSMIGYEVYLAENNNELGVVEDIEEGVEYDYLLVRTKEDKIVHIPFIDEIVTMMEEDPGESKGKITVELPEGLLELF